MSPLTEIVTFTPNDSLKADPSLFSQLVQEKCTAEILRQAWGSRVEEPEFSQWLTDWESLDRHKTANVGGIKERLKKLTTTPINTVNVQFLPFEGYNKAFNAPVTEIILAHRKPDTDGKKFFDVTEASLVAAGEAKGCLGWAWGSDVEDEKAAVLILGWISIEAHEAFHQTETFKVTTPPFKECVSGAKMFHVKFQRK